MPKVIVCEHNEKSRECEGRNQISFSTHGAFCSQWKKKAEKKRRTTVWKAFKKIIKSFSTLVFLARELGHWWGNALSDCFLGWLLWSCKKPKESDAGAHLFCDDNFLSTRLFLLLAVVSFEAHTSDRNSDIPSRVNRSFFSLHFGRSFNVCIPRLPIN